MKHFRPNPLACFIGATIGSLIVDGNLTWQDFFFNLIVTYFIIGGFAIYKMYKN